MKKTLLALTAAASCAFIAKAGVLNQTGFETYDVTGQYGNNLNAVLDDNGGVNGQVYWLYSANGGLTESVITNYEQGAAYQYGEGNASIMVGDASDSPGNKFLSVDATDAKLIRTINAADSALGTAESKAIGEGLFFDSLVQFTATDQPPVPEEGDKLVVWLYGNDDETSDALGLDDPETEGAYENLTTNLVVTAGLVDGMATSATNYVVTLPAGVTVEPGSWHRLTIKAYANITVDGDDADIAKIGGFVVYIDGQPVTSTASKGDFTNVGGLTDAATALGDKLFPSLIKAGAAAKTMTGVAFDGTGAIDDITFTDVDPFPEAAAGEFTVTVATSGTGSFSGVSIDGTNYTEPMAFTVGKSSITVVVYSDDTVTCAQAAGEIVYDGDGGTWTFQVDTSSLAKDAELALSIVITKGGEPAATYSVTVGTVAEGAAITFTSDHENVADGSTVTFTVAVNDDTKEIDSVTTSGEVTLTPTEGVYSILVSGANVSINVTLKDKPATYTVTITGTANATYTAAIGGTAVTSGDEVADSSVITVVATPATGYEYASAPEGWALSNGSITKDFTVNGEDLAIAIPAPTEKQEGKTYPSYIEGDTAKGKYDAWAEYAKIGDEDFPDSSNANKDAYLLNCMPSEVATAAAAFKFTSISYDATEQKWVTTTTTSYNNRNYNGEVEVKSYSDVGCTKESETGNFFKATLK